MNNQNNQNKQPEKKFSAGGVSATVWANQGQDQNGNPVTFHTVSLDRVYVDKQGNYQNTNSLKIADLPKAQMVLDKAYQYLGLKETPE